MNESLVFTSEMFEDAKKYWMDKLSGELNLPRLVGDFPTGKNYVKAGCNLTFTGEIAGELTRIGKNDDLSCFVILLTVFKILIHKYTGQDDIVVSSPTRSESSQNYNKWIALRDILSPRMSKKHCGQWI